MKTIDKSTWGPGEWQDEPDDLDFIYGGFQCRILRMPHSGHLNGYVKITKKYSGINSKILKVHGGITFEGNLIGKQGHWIGFDCGHWNDFMPRLNTQHLRSTTYKNIEYVTGELKNLVHQIKYWYLQ